MRAVVIDLWRQKDDASKSFRYSAPSNRPIHHTIPMPRARKDQIERANDFDKYTNTIPDVTL